MDNHEEKKGERRARHTKMPCREGYALLSSALPEAVEEEEESSGPDRRKKRSETHTTRFRELTGW